MVKKKKEIIKILPPKFKEIKQETQEKEIEDEQEEEIVQEEGFAGFSASSLTPTLQATNLEQTVQNAPEAKKEKTEEEQEVKYEASIYNMPDYGIGYEQRVARKELQQTRILIPDVEDVRETKLRTEIEEWHELKQAPRKTREDAVLKPEAFDRERKLPFEEKRKYKRIQ